ncbi:MAG TPA: phosphoenolpyruvate carboxykinase (ATP) [Terriglobales bacterium]|nr:phosphoenolpyruvate carboxykinase (ATP) [Terriglobales bacterium]
MLSLEVASGADLLLELNVGRERLHVNSAPSLLIEEAIRRGEASLASTGALAARTGRFTGRTPRDRFLVRDRVTEQRVAWGKVNQPISPACFDRLLDRAKEYVRGRDLFVQECFAGADSEFRMSVRVITEFAWHSLFARNLLRRRQADDPPQFEPELTVLDLPGCLAHPAEDGTHSETFIVLNLDRRIVLIGGTAYAGEIKKSVFSALNFFLPSWDVFPMHCSANVGPSGDTALFFGLSGTGKTTLSADHDRRLIGDDEHGWGPNGIFNFEGGCYAKCIRLSREHEPQIWDAIRYGTVLENVVLDPETRAARYDDASWTENTRAAYPLEFVANVVPGGRGPRPAHVVFLCADAFGVLPPIARLTPDQAMYHFLSGYTAKVAGTEAGVKEPQATFSTCFGAPFLPLAPREYAQMLGERLRTHRVPCWWINTGWTGGGFGAGRRIALPHTRALVNAALNGELAGAEFETDPIFGVAVPKAVPGVPGELLHPRETWRDPQAYDRAARDLAGRFVENFKQFGKVPAAIRNAGPRVDF